MLSLVWIFKLSPNFETKSDPRHRAQSTAGSLVAVSTDAIPAAQRAAYWRDQVLSRIDTSTDNDEHGAFRAQLIRLPGNGAELLQHSASSLIAERSAARCRADQCDDICIDFIAAASTAAMHHAGTRRLKAGDMMVIDLAQPAAMQRAEHQVISLFLPRKSVQALAGEAASLAGLILPATGLAAMLRSHMRLTVEQAHDMSPAHRILAIQMARDMALSILQMQTHGRSDVDELAAGFYQAAIMLISRKCTDPELTPQRVAAALGCSRAGLYRAFVKHGHTVAASIWAARVEHAKAMLTAPAFANRAISEIAFRSGFSDYSTFIRLFKRSYGTSPGQIRSEQRT